MAESALTKEVSCVQCGEPILRKNLRGPAPVFCTSCKVIRNREAVRTSTAKKRMAANRRKRREGMADHHAVLIAAIRKYVLNPKRQCEDCGAAMGRREPMGDRCLDCATCRNDQNLRICRAARKRYLRQFKFDPLFVLRRDNWRCYLCGIETPEHLRGSTRPNAPEIDHVIPIARGGEHSSRNARCACRACNNRKKDKTPSEYRRWLVERTRAEV